MKIAVDTGIGKRGVKTLRSAGHDVVIQADHGESITVWLERARAAGAEALITTAENVGPWAVVFRPEAGEDGRMAAARFVAEHGGLPRSEQPTTPNDVVSGFDRFTIETSCVKKARYDNESLAERVAARVLSERGTPLRVYPCAICGGFHLTRRNAPRAQPKPGWRPAARPWHERMPRTFRK